MVVQSVTSYVDVYCMFFLFSVLFVNPNNCFSSQRKHTLLFTHRSLILLPVVSANFHVTWQTMFTLYANKDCLHFAKRLKEHIEIKEGKEEFCLLTNTV